MEKDKQLGMKRGREEGWKTNCMMRGKDRWKETETDREVIRGKEKGGRL